MTRVTNLGRKRTYLEAGFGTANVDEAEQVSDVDIDLKPGDREETMAKKPRKRRRRKAKLSVHDKKSVDEDAVASSAGRDNDGTMTKTETGEKRKRSDQHAKAAASEHRRLKRIATRHASTTCLACRKKGHTVRDCPEAQTALHDDDAGKPGAPAKSAVGICYRCGSHRHNLSRCKKPENPKDPLPFASCFVCSGKGHLASSCPQNQGKGIYPNGGSCKLCGQTSHLAKDCELRTQETASRSAMMLIGTLGHGEGGADEDDFHVLKRRRDVVQKEEMNLQKAADTFAVPVAAKPKPKVVVFN